MHAYDPHTQDTRGEWIARVPVQTGPQWKTLYQNKSKKPIPNKPLPKQTFKHKRQGL